MFCSGELQGVVQQLLRKNNVELKNFFQSVLERIAREFHAAGLIEQDVEESVHVTEVYSFTLATKLFVACQTSLVLYPGENFPKFIEVLKGYDTMKELAEEMESVFEQARKAGENASPRDSAGASQLSTRFPVIPGRKVYEEALKKGTCDLKYGRVLLLGMAEAGKTSLTRGLMDEPFREDEGRTIVPDVHTTKPVIRRSWAKAAKAGKKLYWKSVSEYDEIEELAHLMAVVKPREELAKPAAVKLFSSADAPPIQPEVDTREKKKARSCMRIEVIEQAVSRAEEIDDPKVKSDVLLHVWDCGGQDVFLEILPIFLTSRTMFLFVFDAFKLLQPSESVITLERMEQWMAMIYCQLAKKGEKGKIYPIGTHGDQLSPDEKEEVRQKLISCFNQKYYSTILFKPLVVDNTTAGKGEGEDKGFGKIRDAVSKMVTQELQLMETPVTWVLFRLVLSKLGQKIVTYAQARNVANDCGISEEDCPSVLNFYHELGVFLFYSQIRSWHDRVIIDPKWLVEQLGKLFRLEGSPDPDPQKFHWKALQENGIALPSLYKNVWKKSEESDVAPSTLMDLLEAFHLASPVPCSQKYPKGSFFLPCILDHSAQRPNLLQHGTKAASLYILFEAHELEKFIKFVPPGFFIRLVTTLASYKESRYKINFYKVHRTRITYSCAGSVNDRFTITELPHAIQVDVIRITENQDCPFSSFCQELASALDKCCTEVLRCYESHRKKMFIACKPAMEITWTFGLLCQSSQCDSHDSEHYCFFDPGKDTFAHLTCEEHAPQHRDNQRYWFIEEEKSATSISDRKAYEEALEKGVCDLKYGRVLLLGTAKAGKTSLTRGLTDKPFREDEESTIVADVDIRCSWAKAGKLVWKSVSEEDEIEELAHLMAVVKPREKLAKLASSLAAVERFSPADALPIRPEVDTREKKKARSCTRIKVVEKAMCRAEEIDDPKVESDVLLHIWDCGGQDVFLEILPIFLTSRTMFLFVFDAFKLLQPSESVITLERMEQWMAMIYCQLAEKNKKQEGTLLYPQIYPIGTRRDRLSKREEEAARQQLISHCYHQKYHCTILRQPLIVNNTTAGMGEGEDEGFGKIRDAVSEMVTQQLQLKAPVAWVLFRLVLSKLDQKIVTYTEASKVAIDCGISEEDCPSVLNFYHELGVFLFYSHIRSWKDHVIINPKWLVERLGKLFRLEGSPESDPQKFNWQELKKSGIAVPNLYNDVWSEECDVTPSMLMDLLEAFHLASPLPPSQKYPKDSFFLPFVLDRSTQLPNLLQHDMKAASLYILFEAHKFKRLIEFVPPGFFTRLVTTLASYRSPPGFFTRFVTTLARYTILPGFFTRLVTTLAFFTRFVTTLARYMIPPGFFTCLATTLARYRRPRYKIIFDQVHRTRITYSCTGSFNDKFTITELPHAFKVDAIRNGKNPCYPFSSFCQELASALDECCKQVLSCYKCHRKKTFMDRKPAMEMTWRLGLSCLSPHPGSCTSDHYCFFDPGKDTSAPLTCKEGVRQHCDNQQYWLIEEEKSATSAFEILKQSCRRFPLGAALLLLAIAFFTVIGVTYMYQATSQSGSEKDTSSVVTTGISAMSTASHEQLRISHQSKCNALRKCYPDFIVAISANLTTLKNELYAKGLITSEARDNGSADVIASSCESTLSHDESAWDKLIDVLHRSNKGRVVADQLKDRLLKELLESNTLGSKTAGGQQQNQDKKAGQQAASNIKVEITALIQKLSGSLYDFYSFFEEHKILTLVIILIGTVWIAYKYNLIPKFLSYFHF